MARIEQVPAAGVELRRKLLFDLDDNEEALENLEEEQKVLDARREKLKARSQKLRQNIMDIYSVIAPQKEKAFSSALK